MNEKGLTLIEVLVTMVVLAVGLLAMAQLQVSAINGNVASNNLTVASTLAHDKLEELKGLALDQPALADTDSSNNTSLSNPVSDALDHQDANNPIDSGGGTTGARSYTRVWNVANNSPLSGSKTVAVAVLWGVVDTSTGLPRHRVVLTSVVDD